MVSKRILLLVVATVLVAQYPFCDAAATITSLSARWGGATVPYEFANSLTADKRALILLAFADIEAKTCIRFIQRTNQIDFIRYVNIPSQRGCSSESIGRKGGRQLIKLNAQDCFNSGSGNFGTALSQTCLALGLTYEHNRPDRNTFIRVFTNRINPIFLPGVAELYERNSQGSVGVLAGASSQGTPYDYGSILHFGERDFAMPGKRVIIPQRPVPAGIELGQREELSDTDALGLNRFYSCPLPGPLRRFRIRIRRARNLPFGTRTFVRVAAFTAQGTREVLSTSERSGTNINFQETLDFGTQQWAYFRIQIKNAPGGGNFFTNSETISVSSGSLSSRHCVAENRRLCNQGQVSYQSRFD